MKKLLTEYRRLCPDGICNISVLNDKEKKLKEDGYLILTGILQTADKINGNGRIYSRKILEREMENYQKLIDENRALGECVEEGSEILTLDGWKKFSEISDNEQIYTLNKENDNIEIQTIKEKIDREHDGDIYHIKGRNIDIRVTPGHKFLVREPYFDEEEIVTIKEIYEKREKYDKYFIPKLGNWNFPEQEIEIGNKDLYFLHLFPVNKICLDSRFTSIEKENYNGRVYCVMVPNHIFYCRKNGKSFWTHNCDHPEETIINLKNASHMILRTWWDGDDIWGVIKVLKHTPSGQILEGLLRDEVQLGISSRGLGSLKETPQGSIVQEDLSIICWDVVSDPSTRDAFVHLQENKNITTDDKELFTKADRINRILNDVLRKGD